MKDCKKRRIKSLKLSRIRLSNKINILILT
jgi:hypothetical protein